MIQLLSKLVFLVMGIFHFVFNYILFMWNYLHGNTIWIYNNNSIGEANIEAVVMTICMPFFLYGMILYGRELYEAINS